jgi:hypothetical protein
MPHGVHSMQCIASLYLPVAVWFTLDDPSLKHLARNAVLAHLPAGCQGSQQPMALHLRLTWQPAAGAGSHPSYLTSTT